MTDAFLDEVKARVQSDLIQHLDKISNAIPLEAGKPLIESMKYSLTTGGARLRPLLSCLTAHALGHSWQRGLGVGEAVELIHTYSLIHDDLPCMDDDDQRRGKPTNHKVFGETLAVLAGDSLATEAFHVLAHAYESEPQVALDLVHDLAKYAGPAGMSGGQAMDMGVRGKSITVSDLEKIHRSKTGALLKFAILGAATACQASPEQRQSLEIFAEKIGLLFQISDDFSDDDDGEPNYVNLVGADVARMRCEELMKEGKGALADFGTRAEGLIQVMDFIYQRAQK